MKNDDYIVTLTNGVMNHDYSVSCMGEKTAIILAQAEAIKAARGCKLVSVRKV